jgi:aspartate/methionine/tyrosine aminotransferase
MAPTNPGDEVLVPGSGFVCYQPNVLIADGKPMSTPVLEGNMFKLNADFVMSHITARSRLMIGNSLNDPTGAVFSYGDLESLSKPAIERDSIVISDEVYERITYDEAKHYCLASFLE